MEIKFGTDGWRAVIAEDFTFDNVARVAEANARFWKTGRNGGDHTVIVGFDRRFLSPEFAASAARIFAGHGFAVILADRPVPTPAVSYAVRQHQAVGGVMITASHNPPVFNGYKIKAEYGGSAEASLTREIEKLLPPAGWRVPGGGAQSDRITEQNLRHAHHRAVKKMVDFNRIAESKLKVAHDPLFGVGAGCFDEILAGTSCQVTTLNEAHNPLFGGINPEPVEQNYARSAAFLREHPHDICIVTDGDADRVGAMDGQGNYLTTHEVICLLLHHAVVNRQGTGRVVKALTTTSMVDRMCAHYGLELVETGVGFKYIAAEIQKGDVLLGFEESGGIAFPGYIPERDGILSGLVLLELLATEKTGVNELLGRLTSQFGPHAYARSDITFPVEKRAALMDYCRDNPPGKLNRSPLQTMKTFDGVKFIAANGAWLMLRGSGTEPVLRIYAEAPTAAEAQRLIRQGLKMTKEV